MAYPTRSEKFADEATKMFPDDKEIQKALQQEDLRRLNQLIGHKAEEPDASPECKQLYGTLRLFITASTC